MSQLIDAYSSVNAALEDWIHVIKGAGETTTDPFLKLHYGMMVIQLGMTVEAIKSMSKTSQELEAILLELGLKPRTTDTASLEALWREDIPE